MEKIKFITDSSSDISAEDAKKFNIEIIPMGIIMDDEYYNEGIDFTKEEFYELMFKCKKLPSTSAINPSTWFDVMEKHLLENEYTRLVIITVGKSLSTTYNSALKAKQMLFENYPEKANCLEIDIYDSGSASAGYGHPIIQAIKKLRSGLVYQDIINYFDDWFNSLEVYLVAFSFDVAKKSGRINASTAYIGEKLNLRPIVQNMDGVFKSFDKARGNANVAPKLLDIVKHRMREGSEYIFLNGTQPNVCENVHNKLHDFLGYAASATFKPGPAMVINAGPSMFCLGFLGKKRNPQV